MNLDTDAWLQFLQDNWLIVVLAIAAIFIIIKLVKTVLKWILIAAIIVAILTYGGYSINDMKDLGTNVKNQLEDIGDKISTEVKDQAIKAMAGEASEAAYVDHEDGSYSITSTNLELTGVPNTGEVTVKFHGQSLGTWKLEGEVRKFVVQARASAK